MRVLLLVGAAVAIVIAAVGAGQWLASYRAASAAAQGCGSLEAGALPQAKAIRSIRLDQRWTNGGAGTLCVAGIRVYDGSFEIISYEEGLSSFAQPWFASHMGMSLGLLSDDRGRTFPGGSRSGNSPALGKLHIDTYGTMVFPVQAPQADLLAGVHELHLKVDHVLQAVPGPWRFDATRAQSGALSLSATAAGREMHLYDLVVRPDGFSVAYLPLGQVVTGTVVVTDPPKVRDDRGTTYQYARVERVGSSANLYARFTPAPPADAALTIEIATIYISSNDTWDGRLTLP